MLAVAVDRDIIDLAEDFLRNRHSQARRAREAISAGDVEVLRRVGHELKGTAGSYGFHDLSTIGAELERAALDGDLDGAGKAVERFAAFLERVSVVPR